MENTIEVTTKDGREISVEMGFSDFSEVGRMLHTEKKSVEDVATQFPSINKTEIEKVAQI